jgi:hypothetical protein
MGKPTSGPYVFDGYAAIYAESNDLMVASLLSDVSPEATVFEHNEEEAKANARLLAASWELLEACKKVLQDEMSDWKAVQEFGGYVLDDDVRDAVKAAVAKAEEGAEG